MHYYVSEDDCVLLPDGKGSLRYAEVSADGRLAPTGMVAHAADARSAAERRHVQSIDRQKVIEGLAGRMTTCGAAQPQGRLSGQEAAAVRVR